MSDFKAGSKSASEPSECPTKDQSVEAVVQKEVNTGRPKLETTKAEQEIAKEKRESVITGGDNNQVDKPVMTTSSRGK